MILINIVHWSLEIVAHFNHLSQRPVVEPSAIWAFWVCLFVFKLEVDLIFLHRESVDCFYEATLKVIL